MASLYPEKSDMADPVCEVGALLGISETAAVDDARLHPEHELERTKVVSLRERMEAWRQAHPLGEPTGQVADKAFYDSLNDEEDD